MKIENRSRKQSHKLDGIGVGRIRRFPFLPIQFTTPLLMIQWKLGCRSRKQKRKNQPIAKSGIENCHWFILPLLLATRTIQFSLDRKQRRHKQNQCSASDSVGLIFTRSYRSKLLYPSDYDSDYDSLASENQPLENTKERRKEKSLVCCNNQNIIFLVLAIIVSTVPVWTISVTISRELNQWLNDFN